MAEVSIIILNWNGKEDTYECIKSIYKSDFKDFEIILIDNASSDGSVEFFKTKLKGTKVRLIENKTNLGIAEGMNVGIRNASGSLICLLGNDTTVDKYWLSGLVSAIKSDKDIAIVGSRIKNLIGYQGRETCGEILNIFYQVVDMPKPDTWTSYAPLCSMIFKKKLFENIPFIPEYFGNCEDVYLSMLARLMGYKVIMNPKSYLTHKGGASVRKVPTIMDFHMEKNTILNFFILYQPSTILKLLPIFILLNLFNLLSSLFKPAFFNKLKVYGWVIRNYKLILKYRKIVKSVRKKSDMELIGECLTYRLPLNSKIENLFNNILKIYLYFVGIKTAENFVASY